MPRSIKTHTPFWIPVWLQKPWTTKSVLLMTITGVGEILWFVINMMYSTYACLITMAVRGTVGAGIELIKEATEWINKTLKTISGDIESTVDKYKDELNSFLETINKVASVFSDDPSPINLNGTITTLENLSLPSSVNRTVEKLDSLVLPNFKEIQNYTKTLFETPFKEVRDLINGSMTLRVEYNLTYGSVFSAIQMDNPEPDYGFYLESKLGPYSFYF
ncbi:hypothetical protein N7536_009067 [Penicillium majusculum]|nr:hypothetical protein N7536_009067 [Penicillium majusculum]